MSEVRVRTGVDGRVSSDFPSSNFGGGKWLRVEDGGTVQESFIHFKNPAPRGATILSAELRLYSVGTFASSAFSLKRVAAAWSAQQLNYNNRPGVTGTTVTVTQAAVADADEFVFDVQAQLQTITDGAANRGFRLTTTATAERRFYSLDSTDYRPVLVVEWSDAPDAPTEMSPSAGSAVSVSKPVLTFNFHDVSGSTQMASLQVHIKATNSGWTAAAGYAAPDFDSGEVASSDPELDLATTAFAGITAATTKWWTVRVKDAAGLWSEYSEPVSFTRITKGTLAIDFPSGGVVDDPTPEIAWTLTGGTQLAWQVIIVDDADPTTDLINTGRVAGTADTYTPPEGVITDETTQYRLTVRVWDDPNRVSTPGDRVRIEAVETFTFDEDPTPDPFTTPTAGQVSSGRPWVRLTFDRATAPDGVSIQRNGKWVAHNLDPADLFVSGTTYAYVDRNAAPHKTHTYKIRPRVNGKLGPAVSITYTYELSVAWLSDQDTGRQCPIHITDSYSFDMPYLQGSYMPVNGKVAVDIVQAQYGLQGVLSGRVVEWAGLDADDSVADLLWMKARPQNVLRLILGAQSLRVKITDVVVSPLAGGHPDDRAVSLTFKSQDGVTQE